MNAFIQLHSRYSRTASLVSLLLLCVASDQLAKQIVERYLSMRVPLSFFSNILRLEYVENSGGFLGFLSGLPEDLRFILLTCGVAALLAVGVVSVLATTWFDMRTAALAIMVLGGGMGNLIDRLVNDGRVIDFLNIGLGDFRTGIFNLADIYILVGSFALGVLAISGDMRRGG